MYSPPLFSVWWPRWPLLIFLRICHLIWSDIVEPIVNMSPFQVSFLPGCTWTFSTAELRGIAQLFFSTNTEYYVHHCYSAVLDSAVLNIYKCWNKKNPVKVLNIMYTIVIQHCWIVKNSAQLQKFSAVLNFMYTLVWSVRTQDSGQRWRAPCDQESVRLTFCCLDLTWAGRGDVGFLVLTPDSPAHWHRQLRVTANFHPQCTRRQLSGLI